MRKYSILTVILFITLFLFMGCGVKQGNREYKKAIKAKEKGDFVRARSILEKALLKTTSNIQKAKISNQLAIILWELDDLDQAEILFNDITPDDLKNKNTYAIMSCISLTSKNWENAHNNIIKALSKDPNNPKLKNLDAIIHLHINPNKPEVAGWKLEQIIKSNPDYLPARYNLGTVYEKWINDNESALIHYIYYTNNAALDAPRISLCQEAITRINSKKTENTSSEPIDEAAIKIIEQKGSQSFRNKNYQQAISYWKQALDKAPKRKTLYFNLGLGYHELNNHADALNSFKNALKIDNRYENARYMLAVTYYHLGDYDKAEFEARKARSINPDRARTTSLINHIAIARQRSVTTND